jgi:hypothetical protein
MWMFGTTDKQIIVSNVTPGWTLSDAFDVDTRRKLRSSDTP